MNLPDGNGFDFLREIKQSFSIPVILLTADDMETDIVTGLELGADDYITKPFSLAVLRARVNAALRRSNIEKRHSLFLTEYYHFDFDNMEFFCDNKKIELSKTEKEFPFLPWLLLIWKETWKKHLLLFYPCPCPSYCLSLQLLLQTDSAWKNM